MTKFRILLISLLILASSSSQAENKTLVKSGKFQTAVVELYTSEGCSSCPPADNWLSKLIDVPKDDLDVLALAFHVDYWDYIGWVDEFATPRHTDRQRRLARLNRQNSIYTPEFFVDGLEARGTLSILEKIRKANQTLAPVQLELSLLTTKNQYQLQLTSQTDTKESYKVHFIVFENNLNNKIQRGENEGKSLNHQRVVRYMSSDQNLDSDIQHEIDIQPDWKLENLGIAALVKSSREEYVQSVHTLLNQPIN